MRRLEEDGSWAAVIGVSVPLGSGSRSEPGIRAAQAELAALSLEREAEALTLEATLVEAHTRLSGASLAVATARDVLIPKFEQAERASERAFRAGALTYIEWAQVQADVMSVRSEQLLAAVDAHRALIEIQRLTGVVIRGGLKSHEQSNLHTAVGGARRAGACRLRRAGRSAAHHDAESADMRKAS